MARKPKHEEHENHERWLVSYADFITLLFAFFVVMYAVSSVNEGKYRVLSESLIAAFRSTARSLQPIQVGELTRSPKSEGVVNSLINQIDKPPPPMQQDRRRLVPEKGKGGEEHQRMQQMEGRIERALQELIDKGLIVVRRGELWLEVEINTSILFPSGSARLEPEAVPVLRRIAGILKDFPNPIRVEGYTDNVPIHTLAFPSNWELSAARAASVVHLFTSEGVDPRRMAAIGYGEYRPVADNATEAGRARNRRVVLVILENAAAERLFSERRQEEAEHLRQGLQGAGKAPGAQKAAPEKASAKASGGGPPAARAPAGKGAADPATSGAAGGASGGIHGAGLQEAPRSAPGEAAREPLAAAPGGGGGTGAEPPGSGPLV
ncbi:MAG: flagellar motor protein MotD, partial [Gammaproteobacteria bacterium]